MEENVLVKFAADTTGLKAGIDELQELGKVDKSTAEQFKQTNLALGERAKVIKANGSELSSFSNQLNNVAKGNLAAFGTKAIQDYKKAGVDAATAITAKLKTLLDQKKALDASKLKGDDLKLYNIAAGQLEKQITQLQDELKKLGASQPLKPLDDVLPKVAQKTTTATAQLRAMRQELLILSESGGNFSQKYNKSFADLQRDAATLADDISDASQRIKGLSSDSAGIDAAAQGLTTITAGFQVYTGLAALAGDEDKKFQETLVKLNAVMALTSGIQQIVNNLQKESVLVLKLQQAGNAVLGASNLATAQTFEFLGLSVEADSLAFKGLRTAILSTGIGALILLVGYLITNFNKADSIVQNADQSLKDLGGTVDEIAEKAIAELTDEINSMNKELNITPSAIDKVRGALDLLKKQAEEIKKDKGFFSFDLSAQGIKNSFTDIGAAFGLTEDRITTNANLQAEAREKIAEKMRDSRIKTAKEEYESLTQSNIEFNKNSAQLEIDRNESIIGNDKLSFAERTNALRDNLTQQRAIIQQDLNKSLSETGDENKRKVAKQVANNDLIKAELDYEDKLRGLQEAAAAKQKEIAEKNAAALLAITVRHLQQEADAFKTFSESNAFGYDVRLNFLQQYIDKEADLLNAQRANELSKDKLTAAQRLDINDKYDTAINDLTEKALEQRNVIIKLKNDDFKKQDDTFYQHLHASSEKAAADAIASVEKIYTDLAAGNEKNRANDLAALDKRYSDGNIKIEDYEIQRQRIIDFYETENLKNNKSRYDTELANLEYQHNQGLVDEQTYQAERAALLKDKSDAEAALFKATEDKKTEAARKAHEDRQEIEQKAFDIGSTLVNGLFSITKSNLDAEAAANDELYSRKIITEREHDKRSRQIKRQQAIEDKEQAIFSIAVQTAQNIIKDHLNPILIGLDLGAFFLQSGIIAAQKIPYKKGGYTGDQFGEDQEAGIVHGREYVLNAKATKRFRPLAEAMNAMNNLAFDDHIQKMIFKGDIDLSKFISFNTEAPVMSFTPSFSVDYSSIPRMIDSADERFVKAFPQTNGKGSDNRMHPDDIKALAKETASETAKQQGKFSDITQEQVVWDENGVRKFVIKENSKTEFVNAYYSMKGTKK